MSASTCRSGRRWSMSGTSFTPSSKRAGARSNKAGPTSVRRWRGNGGASRFPAVLAYGARARSSFHRIGHAHCPAQVPVGLSHRMGALAVHEAGLAVEVRRRPGVVHGLVVHVGDAYWRCLEIQTLERVGEDVAGSHHYGGSIFRRSGTAQYAELHLLDV